MLSISPIRCNPGRKPTGAKLALKPVHAWGIRVRLQVASKARDLALFDLALDSKLRGCDLVSLKVEDLLSSGEAGLHPSQVRPESEQSPERYPPTGTGTSGFALPPELSSRFIAWSLPNQHISARVVEENAQHLGNRQ